jgi:hypothetical protein
VTYDGQHSQHVSNYYPLNYRIEEESLGVFNQKKLMVDYGPITPDQFLVPKSSVKDFDHGVVHLNRTQSLSKVTIGSNKLD